MALYSRWRAMHATTVERNSWRLPPDDTVQVADQRSKSAEVRLSIRGSRNNDDMVRTGFKVLWRYLHIGNSRHICCIVSYFKD
jgi:hypothetical protein